MSFVLTKLFFFIFVVRALSDDRVQDFSFPEGITKIDETNYAMEVESSDHYLLLLYEFSPHSQGASHIFGMVPNALKDQGLEKVRCGIVNCGREREFCSRFYTKNLPSLKIFKNGKEDKTFPSEISDPGRIVNWVRHKVREKVFKITSKREFLDLKDEYEGFSFVIKLHNGIASRNKVGLRQLADFFEDLIFVTVDVKKASKKYIKGFRLSKDDSKSIYEDKNVIFMVYKAYNKRMIKLKNNDKGETIDDLGLEIFERAFPLVEKVTEYSLNRMATKRKPICILFLDVEGYSEKEFNEYLDPVRKVAQKYKDNVTFGYADTEGDYKRIYLNIGGEEEDFPNIGCLKVDGRDKYIYKSDLISEDAHLDMEVFVKKLISNELIPHIKSEKFPTQDTPLYKVVAKTYEKVVLKEKRDVLILFHSGGGQAASMGISFESPDEKELKNFAITVQYLSSLRVANFDLSKNDMVDENVIIDSLPKLVFFRDGEKDKPIFFEGNIKFQEIAEFALENAKQSKNDLISLKESGKLKVESEETDEF